MPAEVIFLQKAEILVRQLAKWPASYALSEGMETSKSHEAYENVKAVALSLKGNRAAGEITQSRRHMSPTEESGSKTVGSRSMKLPEHNRLNKSALHDLSRSSLTVGPSNQTAAASFSVPSNK